MRLNPAHQLYLDEIMTYAPSRGCGYRTIRFPRLTPWATIYRPYGLGELRGL